MVAPAERGTFPVSEIKLTRDVTPQEIAERTGGSMNFAGGGFITAIDYKHTERLQILTERPHRETRERLSHLKVPIPDERGEMSVVTFPLDDTITILRPDSVTFVIPIRSEKAQCPSQLVKVTIFKEGFSYSTLAV